MGITVHWDFNEYLVDGMEGEKGRFSGPQLDRQYWPKSGKCKKGGTKASKFINDLQWSMDSQNVEFIR